MAFSTGAIAALVVVVIGIVLFIIGLILYEMNHQKKRAQPPYVYGLLFGGLIVAIVAGLFLAYVTRMEPRPSAPAGKPLAPTVAGGTPGGPPVAIPASMRSQLASLAPS